MTDAPAAQQQQQQQQQQQEPQQFRVLSTAEVQQMLEENAILIKCIYENQSLGKLDACVEYQARLQENLMLLAKLADAQAAPQQPAAGAGQ